MKLKLLSIMLGLVMAFALTACTDSETTEAPGQDVSQPDVTAPTGSTGYEVVGTFLAGFGAGKADTVSQAAYGTVSSGAINVCGNGLAGSAGSCACGYDPTPSSGGTYTYNWTMDNCAGVYYACVGVEYLGPGPDCAGNQAALAVNPADVASGSIVVSAEGSLQIGAQNSISFSMINGDGYACHLQFNVVNDPGAADCPGNCGNGLPDVGEACDDGAALNGTTTCGCDATCQYPSGNSCDDGLFCNENEVCDGAGSCGGGNALNCDDGAFCNGTETCNEATDTCDSAGDPCAPLACDEIGDTCPSSCGDGIVDGGAGEQCDPGAPQNDTCCDPLSCQWTANGAADPQGACDDGTYCNGDEFCDGAGGCLASSGDPCLGGPQCNDTCDEVGDTCFTPNGTGCDDGLFCNENEVCDGAGACGGGNALNCDDGAFCNGAESCNEGTDTCDSAGDPCLGGPQCNDTCDEVGDTCFTPNGTGCDDGLFCNENEVCDGAGACGGGNALNCDDGAFCNGAESCNEGTDTCDSAGDPCLGGPQCNDTCDEVGDNCFTPNGTGCDDGLFCNENEVCDGAGTCGGGNALVCDDLDPCTADSCNEGTDVCDAPCAPANCGDGLFCACAETCDESAGAQPANGCPGAGETCNNPVCDTCSGVAGNACTGTITVTLDDGTSPKPVAGIGNNADATAGGATVAYTAVVNNGPAQMAYGWTGDWVDKVTGLITSTVACDGTEVITIGYTGTSGRTASAVDVSACDGSTTFSMAFSADAPFIDLGQSELMDIINDPTGTLTSLAVPAVRHETASTTEDIVVICDGGAPQATSTTVWLANDGGLDTTCTAGSNCDIDLFAYCDTAGATDGAPGTPHCYGNPIGNNLFGLAIQQMIAVFDAADFTGVACNGTIGVGQPCNAQAHTRAGMDYTEPVSNLSDCRLGTDFGWAANTYVQRHQISGAGSQFARGLVNTMNCPLGVQAAPANAVSVVDFADATGATCTGGAGQAWAADSFTYGVVSCGGFFGAATLFSTATASATITLN